MRCRDLKQLRFSDACMRRNGDMEFPEITRQPKPRRKRTSTASVTPKGVASVTVRCGIAIPKMVRDDSPFVISELKGKM